MTTNYGRSSRGENTHILRVNERRQHVTYLSQNENQRKQKEKCDSPRGCLHMDFVTLVHVYSCRKAFLLIVLNDMIY